MKKLLIVTDAWFPQVNGVVTAMDKIREEAETAGYRVTIVHPEMFLCVPFPIYPEIKLAMFPYRALKRIILAERPDYVHITTEWTLGFTARSICGKWKIPFTTAYHTNISLYIMKYMPIVIAPIIAKSTMIYMRWFHNSAVHTLISTETMQKELKENGFTKIVPWRLGVDTKLFSPARASEDEALEYPRPFFTYVGRIAKEKNLEEFLEAELPGTKIIIGDGPEMKNLQEMYFERAKFLGCKKGVELARLLAQSNVLVFPSKTETFGLVMLEALASGVPVAAHHATGLKDVISSGVDGYLDDNLTRAALACLSITDRRACRTKAEQFSWSHSAELFLAAAKPSAIRSWSSVSKAEFHKYTAPVSQTRTQLLLTQILSAFKTILTSLKKSLSKIH